MQLSSSVLKPSVVRKMSRSFAEMSVTDAAIEELPPNKALMDN